MKRSDVSFDNWIVSEDIELIIDGSYDSGWWEDFFHNDYCYAYNDKNQNENFGDYQISLYFKNDKVGYLSFNLEVNQKSSFECDYDPWVFYIEILEIGLQIEYSNLLKYLFDYLIQYAIYCGAKFIKIVDNINFDKVMRYVMNIENIKCIPSGEWSLSPERTYYYIPIENTNIYEEYEHFKLYDDDYIGAKDLYFFYSNEFIMARDKCYLKVDDDIVAVDRKTGLISFPSFITNNSNEPIYINDDSYHLLFYLSKNLKKVKENKLTLSLEIPDLGLKYAKLGNNTLIFFTDIIKQKNVFDILYKIKKFTKIDYYEAYISSLESRLYMSGMYYVGSISKHLLSARMCLDTAYTITPTQKEKRAHEEFNNKLDELLGFRLLLKSELYNIKEIKILFNEFKLYVTYTNNKTKTVYANIDKYLEIIKNAYFLNWKQEYNGENKPIKWGINLVFKDEQLKYIGVNDTPKIWQYFIDELFEEVLKDL